MADVLQYRKGAIIVFTTGCYSNFSMAGFLVAVQDLDLPKLAQRFAAEERAKVPVALRGWHHENADDFPSWLVANGFAMPVESNEVHLGDYGWATEFGVPHPYADDA